MRQQYLDADEEEDETTQEFGLQPVADATAEADAEQIAYGAEQKGTHADGYKGPKQGADAGILHHSHRDAHGEGVDAGGDGLEQLGAEPPGIDMMVLNGFAGIEHHTNAKEGEQAEGYPVVVGCYVVGKATGDKPS